METLEKVPAWQLTKVRNKNEVIDEARNEENFRLPLTQGCHFNRETLVKHRCFFSDIEILMGGHFPCSTGRELYQ